MVNVIDAEGRVISIPLNSNDTISFKRLNRFFDGAIGLSYEENEQSHAVRCDDNDVYLVPPEGGWGTRVYRIVRPSREPADICNLAPKDQDAQENRYREPNIERAKQYLFFTRERGRTSTVICIHPRYFVTYRHASHVNLHVGDTFNIFKEGSEREPIPVTVVQVNELHCFILLKSERDVVRRGPVMRNFPTVNDTFVMTGYGDPRPVLRQHASTTMDLNVSFFNTDWGIHGPFIMAKDCYDATNAGAAWWSCLGLVGMTLASNTPQFNVMSCPATVVVPAIFFEQALMVELDKGKGVAERRAPKCFADYPVTLEGIGDGLLVRFR